MIAPDERQRLLALARGAITASLRGRETQPLDIRPGSRRVSGAFVTLHSRGELRGCIGNPDVDQPIDEVVAHCAVASATEDPRFPPLTAAELDEVDLEISVLGPLEPISSAADITIGKHGLVVERDVHRGLLLPQVAVEWGWDAETFLDQTCRKAGLPPGAWKSGASIYRFEAEVFGE